MLFEYETERLQLRVLDGNSAIPVLRFYLSNQELFERYEATRANNFYTENYQRRVLNYEYNLCIRLSSVRFWVFKKHMPNRIIGTICLRNIIRGIYQSCDVGYKFDQQFWHHGYATEALKTGIAIAFEELELHRMVAHIMPENAASIQLVKRLGFQCEGIERHSAQIRGVWEDHLVYSLLNT